MKTTSFFILLALLASCESKPKETTEQADVPQTATKPDSLVNCYQYANQGDTVTLTLVHAGENVIGGSLVYQFKEKDNNRGIIQGSMKGDLLLANYTFMSEGTQSTRQVAFKQIGNTFVEGYGESTEENGVTKFRNIDSLSFSSSLQLKEVTCQ